jgi:MarR family 2-MHQ and catechol resistance regulon transcriptional repressor
MILERPKGFEPVPTHYKGKQREVRVLDALIKLTRCAAALEARLEAGLKAEGFSGTQFGVLEALLHLGPLEPCDLQPKLLTSRANLVGIVDQLEDRKLLRRVPHRSDRRRVLLELTAEGRKQIEKTFSRHLERLLEEMSVLDPSEQELLAGFCKRLGRGR